MGAESKIEWTDATWNPVTGCTKVSPGCDHCYAEGIAERFRGPAFPNGFDVTLRESRLREPFKWREPKRVFVNSMSDLFHEAIPDDYIVRVFDVMQSTPWHTFQVLTKRHARMRSFVTRYLSGAFATRPLETSPLVATVDNPPPNIWLGVSVEDQKWADIRLPALRATPAAIRFLSVEPLLGPITFRWRPWVPFSRETHGTCHLESICHCRPGGVDWIIVGGESGAGARPMDPAWVRQLRDEAVEAGAHFFFKQWGSHDERGKRMSKHAAGRTLDGRTWDEYPQAVTA